jgi:2-methylaconitate isomerase
VTRIIELDATYMRGGTSKGVFFNVNALPEAARRSQAALDELLLRALGSPDPYGKQIDGMGAATSSTSKVVIVGPSDRADCDVDYLFGAVSIEERVIDWSGNCGNLSAAVGPFSIAQNLLDAPRDGMVEVRIWQANIGKRIVARVPMRDGQPLETGDFELDGVPFPSAAIELAFHDPAGGAADQQTKGLFPTGHAIETFSAPGFPSIEATFLNAGNPTIFVDADSIGLKGIEGQAEVNADTSLLTRLEILRAHGAVRMGLASSAAEATASRPATPKLMFVAPPQPYVAAGGRQVGARDVDLVARILSMGKLHHAMTGTGAVAIAVAAAVPGTIVARLTGAKDDGKVRFGHASGVLEVGARTCQSSAGTWDVSQVVMKRTARRLMVGRVCVPVEF